MPRLARLVSVCASSAAADDNNIVVRQKQMTVSVEGELAAGTTGSYFKAHATGIEDAGANG